MKSNQIKLMQSSNDSNDDEYSLCVCVMCEDGLHLDGTDKECDICGTEMCHECYNKRENLFFTEWLYDVPNKCTECQLVGCRECILLCFTCANLSESFDTYCNKCKKFDEIDCEYHTWYVCDEHKNDECGECYANRNYHHKISSIKL